ncbi:MAG: class B sortase [Bacilli bacterium]|nr:class B sortase [Bacilli bacterium]
MKRFFSYIFETTINGFLFIVNTISNGFYSISIFIVKIFNKIFRNKFDKTIDNLYKRGKPETLFLIVIYIFSFTTIFGIIYSPSNTVKLDEGTTSIEKNDKTDEEEKEDKKENNDRIKKEDKYDSVLGNYSFYKFGATRLSDVNFNNLRKVNSNTVAWIAVDGTNINYPVVKSSNNDYYLNHSFNRTYNRNGWVFMDYRNHNLNDKNTIFYGHNLLNGTSFGTIARVFTKKWYNSSNHMIIVLMDNKKYIYEIFSNYYSPPIVDYLQVSFNDNTEFDVFVKRLKNKSKQKYNVNVNGSDQIITLSTCTDDNKGRKVVHAKLIGVTNR